MKLCPYISKFFFPCLISLYCREARTRPKHFWAYRVHHRNSILPLLMQLRLLYTHYMHASHKLCTLCNRTTHKRSDGQDREWERERWRCRREKEKATWNGKLQKCIFVCTSRPFGSLHKNRIELLPSQQYPTKGLQYLHFVHFNFSMFVSTVSSLFLSLHIADSLFRSRSLLHIFCPFRCMHPYAFRPNLLGGFLRRTQEINEKLRAIAVS